MANDEGSNDASAPPPLPRRLPRAIYLTVGALLLAGVALRRRTADGARG